MKKTKNRLEVLEVLGSHIDGCPPPHPASRIRLAMNVECSKQHIHKTLNDLLAGGFIIVSREKQRGYDGKLPYWLSFYQLAESIKAESETELDAAELDAMLVELERIEAIEDYKAATKAAEIVNAEVNRIKRLKKGVRLFCKTTNEAIDKHNSIYWKGSLDRIYPHVLSWRFKREDVTNLIRETEIRIEVTSPDKSPHFNAKLENILVKLRALTDLA
jgi:hypothetical protein